MVWPKSKIQLVASSASPGIAGVRAVMKGIQLEFSEGEDLIAGIIPKWWELPFDQMATANEVGPVTDVVFWSEETEHNVWREKALAEDLNQHSIQSFIHNILDNEVILGVSEPTILIEGRPLLGHVLQKAGFEPTILWPTSDGEWQCERLQGSHWVIPQSWQESLFGTSLLGRSTATVEDPATWVVRESTLDFYQGQNGLKFMGQVPRWPEPMEEQVAVETIAKCLNLGVSWLDIKLALSPVYKDLIRTDNLRWNINDIGRNAGTRGEELPAEPIDDVEDWWARRDGLLA
ncbi:MAG TPA: hypothetical protein DD730_14790 [Desulfosporosinus sp.]|nr:hypothetical protein [Desulfosporosinus sp.]